VACHRTRLANPYGRAVGKRSSHPRKERHLKRSTNGRHDQARSDGTRHTLASPGLASYRRVVARLAETLAYAASFVTCRVALALGAG
jgi:hypothetical protein